MRDLLDRRRGPKVCRRAWRPYGARRCGGLILRAKRWCCGLYGSGSAGADGGPAGAEASPGRRHAGPAGRRGVGAAACKLVRAAAWVSEERKAPVGEVAATAPSARGPIGGRCQTDATGKTRKELVARVLGGGRRRRLCAVPGYAARLGLKNYGTHPLELKKILKHSTHSSGILRVLAFSIF